jgi:hypothetical protein
MGYDAVRYYGTTGTVRVGANMCRCNVGAPSPVGSPSQAPPSSRILCELFLALSSYSGRRRNDVAKKGWNHDDSQPLRGESHCGRGRVRVGRAIGAK